MPPHPRSKPATLLLALLAAGCASPGPPRPPSLQLPNPARDLHALRIGPTVVLDWTIPSNTTDGDGIRGPVTSILCRRLPAGPCVAIGTYTHAPGPQRLTDTLPAPLLAGPPVLLEYRIDLANDHHRSAGQPVSVFTAAGAAPPPAGSLAITPRPAGALLTWLATSSSAAMHIDRATPAQPEKPRKATGLPVKDTQPARTILIADTAQAGDPGGMLDTSVRPGQPYVYTAQRVETVQLAGRAIELRGLPSPPTPFTYIANFPPAAPTGLVTIPGGGFGAPPSIDLSWDPVQNAAAYNIYRAEGSGKFTRLNPRPVPAPAFRDLTVQPNHPYTYRVTAIDAHNNESAPSPEAKETAVQ